MAFVQINVERITGTGDAKDVICSIVGKLGADTLVMGSHGYGFFKRYPPNFPSV
jgi:nucleotide-binding universal stress UspA family protein